MGGEELPGDKEQYSTKGRGVEEEVSANIFTQCE